MRYYASIVLVQLGTNSGPAHLPYINTNMPFYPFNLFLCSLQTHAAVLGMYPDPCPQDIICRGEEVRSDCLEKDCHNLLLSGNVLMNITMLQLSGTNLFQNVHININLQKQ